ncbi:saccharopine dehydrogenase NADP-binding domain-containing protein [candidate division WOR-3 bacterium]|nr:saccharopine dehydrogenase NADP-binding domain-containing protein [candidate division WOR-3 bacterium]
MRFCVVGCGMQGSVVAQDLCNSGHDVTVFDNNITYLRQLKKKVNVQARQFNVKDKVKFIKTIKDFDVVVGALPAALGFYTMDCALKARVDIVDMSYSVDDPFVLHDRAREKGIRIVPDAGFAPGLSNVLVGEAFRRFNGIDVLKIMVGGLPQHPQPPFNYAITWSPADLIEEYTRPTRIVLKGRVKTVETLSGIETIHVPKIGTLECFYTDGLRTLLKTIKGARTMEEKTIRYPGHAGIFKTIIECGFLSDTLVHAGRRLVAIRDVNMRYLSNVLKKSDNRDFSVLIIEVQCKKKKRTYTVMDRYDDVSRITSMARMTAYSGSIIAQQVKRYDGFGVVPPEYFGMDDALCSRIKSELKRRGIRIRTSTT